MTDPGRYCKFYSLKAGRGSRARTRDLRFWRPPLYQLSYTPSAAISLSHTAPKLKRGFSETYSINLAPAPDEASQRPVTL